MKSLIEKSPFFTLLTYECLTGAKLWCVSLLLIAGAAVNHAGAASSEQDIENLLKHAASGDLTSVQKVISSGLSINVSDPVFHATALHNAASQGHVHVVKWLIKNGAVIDAKDGKEATPLIWAAYFGQTSVINLLLDSSAQVNHVPKLGSTALIAAIQSGQLMAVKSLLKHGADPGLADSSGTIPVQAAKMRHKLLLLELLTDPGDEQ